MPGNTTRRQTQGSSRQSRAKHGAEHAKQKRKLLASTRHVYAAFVRQTKDSEHEIEDAHKKAAAASKAALAAAKEASAAAQQAAAASEHAAKLETRVQETILRQKDRPIYVAKLDGRTVSGNHANVTTKDGMVETVRLVPEVRIDRSIADRDPYVFIDSGRLSGVVNVLDADEQRMAKRYGGITSRSRSTNSLFTNASNERVPDMFGKSMYEE
jgi:hypothetical protein